MQRLRSATSEAASAALTSPSSSVTTRSGCLTSLLTRSGTVLSARMRPHWPAGSTTTTAHSRPLLSHSSVHLMSAARGPSRYSSASATCSTQSAAYGRRYQFTGSGGKARRASPSATSATCTVDVVGGSPSACVHDTSRGRDASNRAATP